MTNIDRYKKWSDELEQEKAFVRLLIDRNISKFDLNEEELAEKLWSLVDWWKFKNVWKRPIEKDDAKALRMIEKRLHKQLEVI